MRGGGRTLDHPIKSRYACPGNTVLSSSHAPSMRHSLPDAVHQIAVAGAWKQVAVSVHRDS